MCYPRPRPTAASECSIRNTQERDWWVFSEVPLHWFLPTVSRRSTQSCFAQSLTADPAHERGPRFFEDSRHPIESLSVSWSSLKSCLGRSSRESNSSGSEGSSAHTRNLQRQHRDDRRNSHLADWGKCLDWNYLVPQPDLNKSSVIHHLWDGLQPFSQQERVHLVSSSHWRIRSKRTEYFVRGRFLRSFHTSHTSTASGASWSRRFLSQQNYHLSGSTLTWSHQMTG